MAISNTLYHLPCLIGRLVLFQMEGNCYTCGQQGHYSSRCPAKNNPAMMAQLAIGRARSHLAGAVVDPGLNPHASLQKYEPTFHSGPCAACGGNNHRHQTCSLTIRKQVKNEARRAKEIKAILAIIAEKMPEEAQKLDVALAALLKALQHHSFNFPCPFNPPRGPVAGEKLPVAGEKRDHETMVRIE